MMFYDDRENMIELERNFELLKLSDAVTYLSVEIQRIKDAQTSYIELLSEDFYIPKQYVGLGELIEMNLCRLHRHVESLSEIINNEIQKRSERSQDAEERKKNNIAD